MEASLLWNILWTLRGAQGIRACVMLTLVLRKFILVDTLVYVRLEAGRVVKKQEG